MANPRFDLTTIGEVMLRLSVPVGTRLEQTNALDLDPGGAEANVASLLARLGRRTAWLSALPTNPLGRLIANSLRTAGVDLSGVRWEEGGRVGTYYVEFSTPPRPIQVVYDRADSCAARMRPEHVDWDTLLDTRLLHLTGITPAITPSCHAVVEEAIRRAREAEVPFSLDINYRARLWSTSEAAAALRPLAEGAAILFCSRGDAERVFGIPGAPGEVAQALARHTGAQRVVISNGAEGAVAWDGTQLLTEKALPVQMIDRLGAGDALASGVIHGFLSGNLARGLRYGVTLAALALSQRGDMVVTTPEELEQLAGQTAEAISR